MAIADTPDLLEKLSLLASAHGPFFFAVLFAFIVPYLTRKWFTEIQARGNRQVQVAALQAYRFYYRSAVVTGLVLVVISTTYWIAVQFIYTLPTSDAQFQRRVSEEISRRIFEGVIYGATDDDVFMGGTDQMYRIYFYPLRNVTPMEVKYAIIYSQHYAPGSNVRIQWLDKRTLDGLKSQSEKGAKPTPLELCPRATRMDLVRDPPSAPPRLSFDAHACEGKS